MLAIEPPGNVTHRQAPHDIRALFESRGMRLVAKVPMSGLEGTKGDPAINWYDAYRFERADADSRRQRRSAWS
ncbi:hypothetical protein [Nocardioides sp. CER19]|uniref:hypothetical protein n=1 Tax=Nocardioides sp. CER19 TaxID=3038538 RepID=UPI00244D61AB|nr:hypothetical protein [Nocardioides sp. CER19]MDH2416605.1 hypothetical protein [Nocardioides sp. CER19]